MVLFELDDLSLIFILREVVRQFAGVLQSVLEAWCMYLFWKLWKWIIDLVLVLQFTLADHVEKEFQVASSWIP